MGCNSLCDWIDVTLIAISANPQLSAFAHSRTRVDGPGSLPRDKPSPELPRVRKSACETASSKTQMTFKARFRSRAFGYTGSNPACHRLKEAVAEIKKLAKSDPVQAAEGAVF